MNKILLVLFIMLGLVQGAFAFELVDDFEDSSINTTIWGTQIDGGSASSITESGGELDIYAEQNANFGMDVYVWDNRSDFDLRNAEVYISRIDYNTFKQTGNTGHCLIAMDDTTLDQTIADGSGNTNYAWFTSHYPDIVTILGNCNDGTTSGSYYDVGIWYNQTEDKVYINHSTDTAGTGYDVSGLNSSETINIVYLVNARDSGSGDETALMKLYDYYTTEITPESPLSLNLQDYYNETPVLIEVNTTETNFTYSLNGGTTTLVNSNSSTLSFSNLVQNVNNLTINSENFTFIFDNVTPLLNLNSNLLSETYTVNFNNLINYSDSNLDSCLVFTQGINFSCNSNYTYSYNGNQSFNVTVSDLAGNSISNLNNILPIDPLFYVYFTNSTGGLIENFDVNGTTYNKYFSENIYDYGLGSHTFLFEKLGFNSTLFTLSFNTTSNINQTFSVPGAKLIFTFINIDDGSFIESEGTTTINLIGDEYSTTVSTTNRNYTLQSLEITNDTYQVIVSNPNYEAVNTLFSYTNQEVLEFNLYMTPTNLSDVADLIIEVQDKEGNVQKGITTQQYIWDTTLLESVLVNQKVTDTGGQTSYKVILDTRRYDFCAIYQGTQFCETDQVININTAKVVVQIDTSILEESSATNIYDVDFPYSLTNTTISENVSRVQFSYVNDQQDVDLYIIEIYESVNGSESKIYNDNSTSHSGLLKTDLNIGSGNLFKIVAKIELDGQIRILDSFYLNNEFLLQQATQSSGLDKLLTIAFMIIGVGIGLSKKVHSMPIAHIGLIISLGAITSFFPEILPLELFFFLAFVNVVSSILITKRDDIGTTTNMRKILNSISVYIFFIFSLVFVLQALQTNGNLDDYGERTLNYLTNAGEQSSLETFIEESQQQIDQERLGTSPGGEDKTDNTLTTFIKIVGWAESFFDIMSKVFTIPETLYYLFDISSEFLGLIVSILNWVLNIFIGFIFYREINK